MCKLKGRNIKRIFSIVKNGWMAVWEGVKWVKGF